MTTVVQLPLFPTRRKRPKPALERQIHIAVADLLRDYRKPGWIFFHPANGEYRTKETGALLQRLGVLPGVPDLILIGPTGQHYYLELKRGLAPMSLAQIRFRTELRSRNVPYGVARSFDEAVAFLEQWGVLKGVHIQ
jgi:hypothetical protein